MKISKPYKNVFRLAAVALAFSSLMLSLTVPAYASSTTNGATNGTAPLCGTGSATYTPTIDSNTGEVTATGRCKGQLLPNQTDTAVTCKDANGQTIKCDLITQYANPFITFLAAVAGLIATISIVVGGVQYASSSGDPQKVSAAKKRIGNAVLAIIGFLLLYAFLQWIVPGGYLHG